jgi:hypothetical protein
MKLITILLITICLTSFALSFELGLTRQKHIKRAMGDRNITAEPRNEEENNAETETESKAKGEVEGIEGKSSKGEKSNIKP